MNKLLQVAAIALATLGTGAAAMTVMKPEIADFSVPKGDWSIGGQLDGRSFHIEGIDLDSGRILSDDLVFGDGTFQSINCQTYCNFGWSNYETKIQNDVIHFTATTRCPEAPHTVVWYGTVTGDEIEISGTWTTRRWYWTYQIRFEAVGSSEQPIDKTISG